MENFGYLLAAFSMAWALVFGYVLLLLNRQKRLQQEINSLKEVLKEKAS
jgi:CcmD family protein|tara:strand:- start:451 stop:597 length:147 start_codon:yes stop_codon:yes gene_type:complete